MPRHCVLCGKHQSKYFSVFSFPNSCYQSSLWVDIVRSANPEFARDTVWKKSGLKNGVCQLHFHPSEFSNGKKRRLHKKAVPSRHIVATKITPRNLNAMKNKIILLSDEKLCLPNEMNEEDIPVAKISQKFSVKDNSCFSSETSENHQLNHFGNIRVSFVENEEHCSIEINSKEVFDSKKNLPANYEKAYNYPICLICGPKELESDMESILKKYVSFSKVSVLNSLAGFLEVSEENIKNNNNDICKKCYDILIEILVLKEAFNKKLSLLKKIFNNTQNILNKEKENCYNLKTRGKHLNSASIKFSENIDSKNCLTARPSQSEDEPFAKVNALLDKTQLHIKNKLENNDSKNCFNAEPSQNEDDPFANVNALLDESQFHIKNKLTHNLPTCLHPFKTEKNCCPECFKSFPTYEDLVIHKKSYHRYYDCTYCGRYLTTMARLNWHLFKFHGIGEAKQHCYLCSLCKKSFTSRPGLRYHEQVAHKNGKIYTCEVCDKQFLYKILYKSHKLYSHGNKNIVCEKCGEMFFTVSKLNCHLNAIHRNALSWICKTCNDKFATASAYKHHVTFKHKNFEYKCQFCDAQFKKYSSYTQHLWKHDTYFCQKCNVKFKNSMTFSCHMISYHNIDFSKKLLHSSRRLSKTLAAEINNTFRPKPFEKNISKTYIENMIKSSEFVDRENIYPFPQEYDEEGKAKSFVLEQSDIPCGNSIQFKNEQAIGTHEIEPLKLEQDLQILNHAILDSINSRDNIKTMSQNLPSTTISTISLHLSDHATNSLKIISEISEHSSSDATDTSDSCSIKIGKISNLNIRPNENFANCKSQEKLHSPKLMASSMSESSIAAVPPYLDSHLKLG